MIYRYIYKTINIFNGKIYIGQHRTKQEYDSYLGSGKKLKQAIKKYGVNYFLKGIIEYCNDDNELNEKEIYWIKQLNATDNKIGYNICKGGGDYPILYGKDNPFFNKKHTNETKKKISEARKCRDPWNKGLCGKQKVSDKQKQIASEINRGEKNWNYGKKGILSQNYGLKRSENTKNKLSINKKGVKNPNVGTFEIITPDNKLFIINFGIPEFLNIHPEYNVKKWVLYEAKKFGEYQGWKVIRK